MTKPVCTIIAGPNGAGKTTFALRYLPVFAKCHNFVNADMIASGLSPLAPERELFSASRLFLSEIGGYVARHENFAFETTLSGKAYLRLIQSLLGDGWQVDLNYLWLPDVLMSIERVAERVTHGGHDIPREVIIRRYYRSIDNLLNDYALLCSNTICLDNSLPVPEIIFIEDETGRSIKHSELYATMLTKSAAHD